jgi:hypothetical protein
MREIKFRGKDTNGKWHFGLLSISQGCAGHPEKGYYISNSCGSPWAYQVIPDTVGEFICEKDCEENAIYEGDIVIDVDDEWDYGTNKIRYRIVKLEEGGFSPIDSRHVSNFKVVGNKFDNPELINICMFL